MADYDVVIKGGMVFDGTRNPRVLADIAITDGRVAALGRISASTGTRVFDASGSACRPRIRGPSHPLRNRCSGTRIARFRAGTG